MSRKQVILPFVVLSVGVLLAWVLMVSRATVEPKPLVKTPPLVEAMVVHTQSVRLHVDAQGTVVPRRESELIPQVSGEVVWVSPQLATGGFFEKGESLLRIDPVDYEAELESARAALTRAESEESRARKERERQRRLADRSVASQARIDDTINGHKIAEAMLREARSQLGRAERNLARTELLAPYAGRVRSKNVDVGQFASRGAALASLYAVDYAEVRLPLPDRELRYLNVPLGYSADEPVLGEVSDNLGAEVILRAEFAGRHHEWTGRIVRSEGEIDPRSRMVTLIARVEDPYARRADPSDLGAPIFEAPPLAVGLFVQAEILGLELPKAIIVPRAALQDGDRVLVIDHEQRIRFRDVDVLRRERDRVLIEGGIVAGERVLTTAMPAAVDGMRVRTRDDRPELAQVDS
jgi:RND family efflux transporter MFP subunit